MAGVEYALTIKAAWPIRHRTACLRCFFVPPDLNAASWAQAKGAEPSVKIAQSLPVDHLAAIWILAVTSDSAAAERPMVL
jgi:hypothetical protein